MLVHGGYVEDSALAARSDVLTFTGEPLEHDLTVLGAPRVTLAHRSERPDADLFVRISEVDAKGRSHNVTEGYARVPADRGDRPVTVDLLDTAHTFRGGTRIRLYVAGGSFPQYARNPGTGGNPLTATRLEANQHSIELAAGASVLELPLARA
ncbi:MAG: CocE/NonD family hydrolase [Streptosporangiaceae bacterium]